MSTWWMDCKNIKKKIFSRWLFEIIHIIRFEIWDLRSRDLKIFLGYDINYLSIWPFMGHPWFPTRKASKLSFTCFQHQVLNTLQGLDNWSWKQTNVSFPVSWKHTYDSFEAFLVGNQGSYPKNIFRFIQPVHVHLKTDKVNFNKSHHEKKMFCIFLQSTHQVSTHD